MGFVSSIFLFALPLTAVPVIIHLMNRRRREVIRWGAMRLLMESSPRRQRIWQISDLLLLIARTLAIAAIVLAFARPQIRSSLFSGTKPGRDVILVVDASLSTGRLSNGAPVFDQVRQKAAEVVSSLDDSDHVRVMLAASVPYWIGGDGSPAGALSKVQATEQLASLQPTQAAADMPTCLQAALQAEAPTDATGRLIIVVSDGTAHGWSSEASSRWRTIHDSAANASLPTALNIVTIDTPKTPVANLAVEKLATPRTRVAAGEPFGITAQIRNTGDAPRKGSKLKWEVDGEPADESSVPQLDPGQSFDVLFETACDKHGAHSVTCRAVESDDLPGDNACSVVVESLERLPILICRSGADTAPGESQPDFLSAALGRGRETPDGSIRSSVFEPTILGPEALADSDLSQYRCIIFDDVVPTSAEVLDALSDYVHSGGGLWFVLGENLTPDLFNENLFREGFGLSPVSVRERVTAGEEKDDLFAIHPPEGTHPATQLLGDTDRLDIDEVRIKERWKLVVPDSTRQTSVLLETGDGDPLAVEQFLGDGRVVVLAVPCQSRWSNLPVCQAFVPLVQEWVWYLTQPTAANYNLDAGTPMVVAAEKLRDVERAEISTPLGEASRETISFADDTVAGRELRYRETPFPGDYEIVLIKKKQDKADKENTQTADKAETELHLPFYVRRDAGESRLTPLSEEQLASLTTAGGVRFGSDPLSLPENTKEVFHYEPLWSYLAAAVVLLFFLEFVFSRVLAKKRFDDPPAIAEVVLAAPNGYTDLRNQSLTTVN